MRLSYSGGGIRASPPSGGAKEEEISEANKAVVEAELLVLQPTESVKDSVVAYNEFKTKYPVEANDTVYVQTDRHSHRDKILAAISELQFATKDLHSARKKLEAFEANGDPAFGSNSNSNNISDDNDSVSVLKENRALRREQDVIRKDFQPITPQNLAEVERRLDVLRGHQTEQLNRVVSVLENRTNRISDDGKLWKIKWRGAKLFYKKFNA